MRGKPYTILDINNFNSIDFLHNLVQTKVREDVKVGFYPASVLDCKNQKKLNDLSAIISSYANTVGGVLIFGIKTQRNIAKEIDYITNFEITREWLLYFIESSIFPQIQDVSIREYESAEGKERILVVTVPDSPSSPHMALDRRYYKRSNTTKMVMDEHEVRDIYNKSKRPVLDFFAILNTNGIPSLEKGKYVRVNFYPRFLIKNIGAAIEKVYKVELYIPSGIYNVNFTSLQQYFVRLEDQYSVFSYSNESPLFQHELATVFEANIVVEKHTFSIFSKNDIVLKLFNSESVKVKHYPLVDTFQYRNERLRYEDFAETEILELPINE